MRTITHADVIAAARSVIHLPAEMAQADIRRYLTLARAADRYRKKYDRVHPLWGNGTLAGAVPVDYQRTPEPFLSDPLYLEAISIVIRAILDWRNGAD